MKLLPQSFLASLHRGVALVSFLFAALSPAMAQDRPGATATSSAAVQRSQAPAAADVRNDAIKKPAMVKVAGSAVAPEQESSKPAQKDTTLPDEGAARKALEIASLQKELKAKQERVELLMHLFATDERQFIISPTDPIEDPVAKARIRAEQEELRAQSAACARLKARLDALTAASPQN